MEIQSLDKKLIAALGLAAGAGIALTFTYCTRNERILPRVRTEPKWTPVRVGGSQNSRPIFVTKPAAIGHARQEVVPVPVSGIASLRLALAKEAHQAKTACVEKVGISQTSSHEEAPQVLALQVLPPQVRQEDKAPATSSMTQRFGAAGLDALVIFEAVCLFVGISQAFHVSLGTNPIGAAIVICSVLLIGIFYSFLFKMSGTRTAGQTLLNS